VKGDAAMAADEPAAGALVEPPAAATADQGVATERPGHADAAPAAAPAAATEAPGPAPRTDTYAEVAVKPEYLRVRPAPGAADGSAVGPRPPKRPHGDAAAADGDANAAGADEALEAAGNSAGAVCSSALGGWAGSVGRGLTATTLVCLHAGA